MFKQGPDFFFEIFEIIEFEITRVDCINSVDTAFHPGSSTTARGNKYYIPVLKRCSISVMCLFFHVYLCILELSIFLWFRSSDL